VGNGGSASEDRVSYSRRRRPKRGGVIRGDATGGHAHVDDDQKDQGLSRPATIRKRTARNGGTSQGKRNLLPPSQTVHGRFKSHRLSSTRTMSASGPGRRAHGIQVDVSKEKKRSKEAIS